ncbi:MAG: MFS transporter [Rhizobiaceae bacterium]|nr:MFS transporter [Rhizobiaceae bacterium]
MLSYSTFLKSNFRWLLGGFLLTMFSSFGQTFFVSLSTGDIRQAFGLTSGEYGTIYMVATLASAVTLTFFGRIVDHFSIVKTTTLCTLMLAVACIAFAQAQSLLVLVLALYGLRLFGQGMMTHIAITAMGRWYAQNRGKAVSIASLGFNAGLALFPIGFVAIVTLIGWREAWLVAAGIMVLVALPSIVLLLRKDRTPLGELNETTEYSKSQWTVSQMLRDPLFWLTIVSLLGPAFISTAIFFHQDFLLETRGWSINLLAWTFVMLTVISVGAGLVSGIFIDKTSAASLMPMFLVPLGIGCVILAVVYSSTALIIYMALLGVAMGVNASVFGSIWPEIYGVKNLGAIRSLVTAMMVFSSALGPGVMGWAIDLGISLSTQFVAMAVFCGLGTLALLLSSAKYKKRALNLIANRIQ